VEPGASGVYFVYLATIDNGNSSRFYHTRRYNTGHRTQHQAVGPGTSAYRSTKCTAVESNPTNNAGGVPHPLVSTEATCISDGLIRDALVGRCDNGVALVYPSRLAPCISSSLPPLNASTAFVSSCAQWLVVGYSAQRNHQRSLREPMAAALTVCFARSPC
jgi:hypothetical protein